MPVPGQIIIIILIRLITIIVIIRVITIMNSPVMMEMCQYQRFVTV